MKLTCSKDIRPLSLPNLTMSSRIAFFTSWKHHTFIYLLTVYGEIRSLQFNSIPKYTNAYKLPEKRTKCKWSHAQDLHVYYLISAQFFIWALDASLLGPAGQIVRIGNNDGNQTGLEKINNNKSHNNNKQPFCCYASIWAVLSHLQTVSVYEGLWHSFTPDVNVLDLLWSDVFSLSQLKNVLLTVHEL